MSHRPRRTGTFILIAAAIAIAFPAGVLAAVAFNDVPPDHPFYYDIQAVADKGVTTGCGDNNYCPDDYVTRGQMAAFMNRLGALGPGKTPVVNADKLDGHDASAFVSGREVVSWSGSTGTADVGGQTVECPAGKVPLGGGFDASSILAANVGPKWELYFPASYPTATGWHVDWYNGIGASYDLTIYAICGTAS